ncbi:hypothetical protein PIB30_007873 [Stylosanthes scabra]|uniref:Uncharacterized protein n=1 Tax=Stylosanthes scabra TaxID=79078 RepID=A0ABU6R4H8_9FABA|nr:hypothetical protein [Stylosanthes scabra]
MFQGKSQVELTMLVKRTPVDTEVNRNLFKRAFLIFIQKVFLLPTSSPNVTPKALPTLFGLENTRARNWALHVHDFLLEELKKAKLNNTKAIHRCCYVLMIIYFHETHFGKNAREPEAQPLWIQFWSGENLLKRLNREQNHPTGLVKTGLLRTAKDKLLKRNRELKMGINLMGKYPYSSESESEYDSQVESSSSGSSSSSSEENSESTMSEELVERRPLPVPTPAQGERRSKKKQDSSATGEGPPLGKRKQPDRAAKSKNPNEGKPPPPIPQSHPQPQQVRAAKRAKKPTLDDPVDYASGK